MSHALRRTWPVGIAVMLLAGLAVGAAAFPRQEVWQADVRVQAFDVTPVRTAAATQQGARQLSVRVVVASDNDDDARGARLEMLLPVGLGVLRVGPGCRASPGAVSTLTGRVTCDLGDIPVRGLREVMLSTTAPVSGGGRFAVFVASDTPDPNPTNNYAERPIQ